MQKIGWIGLGQMGTPMALNLVKAGFEIYAYNRTPDKASALAAAGATILSSPAEVVAGADITFLMLADAGAVRSVLLQEQGLLAAVKPGKLVVDMSTIAPDDARAFALAVADRGGIYVDAPVSGSVGAAAAAQLIILAGGDKKAVDACSPCFDRLGKETIYFGADGSGSAAKLAINLLLGITGQGLGEALLLAGRQGVELEPMLELIGKSALGSPFFQMKKELYLKDDFPAAFKLSLMAKDLGLIVGAAEQLNLALPLAHAADATYQAACEHGKADLDMAAVYRELKEQSGTKAEQSAIVWPAGYLPATTDNYVSNEIIVAGLSAADVWPFLDDTSAWPTYYSNASEIRFHDGTGPTLSPGARFRFTTFGFPVEAKVTEYVPPVDGKPARVAWHGWVEGNEDSRLDVHHAWLIEDLSGGRVRILTQETQNGKPARELAVTRPNPMLNAHQEWVDGLARAAAEKQQA